MKKLTFIVVTALIIAMNSSLYAKGGFSLGIFGAYSIDGGAIEKTIDAISYVNSPSSESDSDSVIIPGAGIYARYDFNNMLFLRAGFEIYEMVSGGEIYLSSVSSDYSLNYDAMSWPILFGICLSPDKGKTSIYGCAGIVPANIHIHFMQERTDGFAWESDNSTIVVGFGGLMGIERRIIGNLSILIEYVFYKCEKNLEQSGDYMFNGSYVSEYSSAERYGLPRQQVRVGLRYQF